MRIRWVLIFVLAAMVLGSVGVRGQVLAAPTAEAVPAANGCSEGDLPGGAGYKICVPAVGWNGHLVLWAHGYVVPGDPPTFQDQLPDGTSLPDLVQGLGYAFAATTYRRNGLVVLDAQEDILQLLAAFNQQYPDPGTRQVYLTGASMGGLITTLLAEKYPDKFKGALAACGIVGDFRRHINYWGDFRILFDYFYPGVLAALQPPITTPPDTLTWNTVYAPQITAAVLANPAATQELIAVSKAPVRTADLSGALETIQTLLYFSVLSSDEAAARLGGNPYGNLGRWYWGSSNDIRLNRSVRRVAADPAALLEMRKYETTGKLRIPMVQPHTTRDPVVLFNQTLLYWLKAWPQSPGKVTPLPVLRYGHCTFTANEIVLSFGLLVYQATGRLPLPLAEQIASLDLTAAEAELAAQLEAFQAAEAEDARMQSQAGGTKVYLPAVVR